jgi:hypothetical protein
MENDLRQLKFDDTLKAHLLKRIQTVSSYTNYSPSFLLFIEDFVSKNFESELNFFPSIAYPTFFEGEFTRIVINKSVRPDKKNSQLDNYSQIKYPPKAIEKFLPYNRASLKGQAVFYAGYGKLPVTLETKPKLGDLYTVSKWKQKEDTLISHFPIFFNERFYNDPNYEEDLLQFMKVKSSLDENVSEVILSFLSLLTDVFMKPVPQEEKIGYLFSALFANVYLTKSNPPVECIYYPSVASDYISRNIACLPETLDKYFTLTEIHESICIKSPAYNENTWLSRRISDAVNINPLAIGDIEWNLNCTTDEYSALKAHYKFE